MMLDYDVVVPCKRKYYIETLYSHYAHTHDGGHLDVTRQIISELNPDYIDTFDKVMKQRSGYMFNMFIMSKDNVAAYCEWLFPIINELYKRLDITGYSAFDARLFGRVSERLFNVWIAKQDLRVKEIPFIYMEKIDLIQKENPSYKQNFREKIWTEFLDHDFIITYFFNFFSLPSFIFVFKHGRNSKRQKVFGNLFSTCVFIDFYNSFALYPSSIR